MLNYRRTQCSGRRMESEFDENKFETSEVVFIPIKLNYTYIMLLFAQHIHSICLNTKGQPIGNGLSVIYD
ncbi:MAG: hypothetical protein ACI8ZN_000888 [Bacteroidia bacterium]|jgi:hypothetical protein